MRHFLSFIFACALFIGSVNAQNQGDNALVGRAHQAVGQCVGQAQQDIDGQIQHQVDVVGTCFAGGFLRRVTFYHIIYGPICNPAIDPDCRPALPIYELVATVDFDCEGNIVASTCHWPF